MMREDAALSLPERGRHSRWPTLLIAAAAGACMIIAVQAALRLLPKRPSSVLAVVDGEPITIQRLRDEMARRGGEDAFATPAQRRALLDEVIRVEVLASDARKAGYQDRPEVKRAMDQLLADRYAHDAIEEPLAGLEVTDAEIQKYYQEHLAEFALPRALHVALLVVSVPVDASSEERAAARRRAEEARALALAQPSAPDFGSLAAQYSDDTSTRERGGDVGWITDTPEKPHLDPLVATAVVQLQNPKELSPVIDTPGGFYIAKLIDVRSAVTRPLGEVRASIRQQMIRQEREDRAAKLYAAALANVPVSVNEAAVAAMEAAEESAVGASAAQVPPHGT